MKKERMKGFIAGGVACLLVLSLVGTAAATMGKQTVEVDYTDIKIALDGEVITPTDANGNVVEPFAINGTIYLPVRAVSKALGVDVYWDSEVNTVKLIGKPDVREYYSQVLALIDEWKKLEDQAEWGEFYSDILGREITSSFSKNADLDDIREYLYDVKYDHLASYGTDLATETARLKGLLATCEDNYLKNGLTELVGRYDELKQGQDKLMWAYSSAISYLRELQNRDWDQYMERRKAADEYIFEVKTTASEQYDAVRDFLDFILNL